MKKLSKQQAKLTGALKTNPGRYEGDEPPAVLGSPEKPQHILDDPWASTAWDWCCLRLGEMGMLSLQDAHIIELYAMAYSALQDALKMCREEGRHIAITDEEDAITDFKRAPWDIQFRDYTDRCKVLLSEMGLTHSARAKLRGLGNNAPKTESTGGKEVTARKSNLRAFNPTG